MAKVKAVIEIDGKNALSTMRALEKSITSFGDSGTKSVKSKIGRASCRERV